MLVLGASCGAAVNADGSSSRSPAAPPSPASCAELSAPGSLRWAESTPGRNAVLRCPDGRTAVVAHGSVLGGETRVESISEDRVVLIALRDSRRWVVAKDEALEVTLTPPPRRPGAPEPIAVESIEGETR